LRQPPLPPLRIHRATRRPLGRLIGPSYQSALAFFRGTRRTPDWFVRASGRTHIRSYFVIRYSYIVIRISLTGDNIRYQSITSFGTTLQSDYRKYRVQPHARIASERFAGPRSRRRDRGRNKPFPWSSSPVRKPLKSPERGGRATNSCRAKGGRGERLGARHLRGNVPENDAQRRTRKEWRKWRKAHCDGTLGHSRTLQDSARTTLTS